MRGPGRVPHRTYADLRIGAEARRLVITGDRTWVRNAGKLVPSAPAPWEVMPLSWSLAFGGAVDIPPGPFGPDKIPHPGGRMEFSLNPHGKGFVLDETKAEGGSLPNMESPDAPVKSPLDQPRPCGFAPCPELTGLRLPRDLDPSILSDVEASLRAILRLKHAAPGDLIFDELAPGLPLELLGVGERPLRAQIPPCPVVVDVQKGTQKTRIPPAVRWAHLSADDAAMLVCYGFSFSYEVAPSWVLVSEA